MKSKLVRFDDKVYEILKEASKADSRSENSFIVQAVKEKAKKLKDKRWPIDTKTDVQIQKHLIDI